jgi:UDP-N-acetylglucosamine:LPS N-acetylglucosamine transferase
MTPRRILAISSAGGHWEQLMLLRPGLDECEVVYAVTNRAVAERSGVDATEVPDFNASQPLKTILGGLKVVALVVRVRPDAVISTGAAPGLVAAATAKLLGARVIWVDSVANASRLSLSGRLAGRIADLWLTQWEHLAAPEGPHYGGAVL